MLETIRQIMAARALHNIFKMTESHLLVSSDGLRFVIDICYLQRKLWKLGTCQSILIWPFPFTVSYQGRGSRY